MANAPIIDITTRRPVEMCEKHDMILAYCSFCKPKQAAPPSPTAIEGPHIEAQFDSHCPWCDWAIEVGDLIGLREGEWVCAQCSHDHDLSVAESKHQHPSNPTSGGSLWAK